MSAAVGGGGTGVGTGGQEEDKKPMDQSAHINLNVKGQDGNEVFFRIKRSTQLRKLMTAYCERQSVEFNSIVFLFDGRRLRGEQTPDEGNGLYMNGLGWVFRLSSLQYFYARDINFKGEQKMLQGLVSSWIGICTRPEGSNLSFSGYQLKIQ